MPAVHAALLLQTALTAELVSARTQLRATQAQLDVLQRAASPARPALQASVPALQAGGHAAPPPDAVVSPTAAAIDSWALSAAGSITQPSPRRLAALLTSQDWLGRLSMPSMPGGRPALLLTPRTPRGGAGEGEEDGGGCAPAAAAPRLVLPFGEMGRWAAGAAVTASVVVLAAVGGSVAHGRREGRERDRENQVRQRFKKLMKECA